MLIPAVFKETCRMTPTLQIPRENKAKKKECLRRKTSERKKNTSFLDKISHSYAFGKPLEGPFWGPFWGARSVPKRPQEGAQKGSKKEPKMEGKNERFPLVLKLKWRNPEPRGGKRK